MSFQDSGSETLERIFHISRVASFLCTWKHCGTTQERKKKVKDCSSSSRQPRQLRQRPTRKINMSGVDWMEGLDEKEVW